MIKYHDLQRKNGQTYVVSTGKMGWPMLTWEIDIYYRNTARRFYRGAIHNQIRYYNSPLDLHKGMDHIVDKNEWISANMAQVLSCDRN